jgi:hypothetical protein
LINQTASEHFTEHESLIYYLFSPSSFSGAFLRELERFELGFVLLGGLEEGLMKWIQV